MKNSDLSEIKIQFSGHETFPLRQLWLKKAYKAVSDAKLTNSKTIKNVFSDDQAIVRFGVGKNMISSIRHWALACGIIEVTEDGSYTTTPIGDLLFGAEGKDPYQEKSTTAWLIHWKLAGEGLRSTTWRWLFNYVIEPKLETEQLLSGLESYAADKKHKVAITTLKRDIECCLRSYVPRFGDDSPEEISDSVLGELSLVQQTGRAVFEFRRGAKPTINNQIFTYCLLSFWESYSPNTQTLSFEAIAHEYGSPGRVFKLDEASVMEKVQALSSVTKGQIEWSDTAGISQVIRTSKEIDKHRLLASAYD